MRSRFADEPELVVSAYFTPRNVAKPLLECFVEASRRKPRRPATASTINCISRAPTTLPDGGTTLLPGLEHRLLGKLAIPADELEDVLLQ